eukprot:1320665-Amorphochlora_amoeboformis.AAC.2
MEYFNNIARVQNSDESAGQGCMCVLGTIQSLGTRATGFINPRLFNYCANEQKKATMENTDPMPTYRHPTSGRMQRRPTRAQ